MMIRFSPRRLTSGQLRIRLLKAPRALALTSALVGIAACGATDVTQLPVSTDTEPSSLEVTFSRVAEYPLLEDDTISVTATVRDSRGVTISGAVVMWDLAVAGNPALNTGSIESRSKQTALFTMGSFPTTIVASTATRAGTRIIGLLAVPRA